MPVDARAAGTSDRVPDAKQLLSFVSVHDELLARVQGLEPR
jgi:hypothetical protein